MDQEPESLQAREGLGLAQGSLLAPSTTGLAQGGLLALIDMDLAVVSHLLLDNMAIHQDRHQAQAQVSPQPLASMDQDKESHQARGGPGLAQGSLLAPNNMGLGQEGLLAVVNRNLGKASLPEVGNRVPSLDSQRGGISMDPAAVTPPAMVSMALDLSQVNLPAMGHTTQGQAGLLARGEVALGQDSLLV